MVEVLTDYQLVSDRAAGIIADQIRATPRGVIGFATGGTPIGAYDRLVALHRTQGLDFSTLTTFNLDEYVGLSPDHPQSYHSFMWQHLFGHVNIRASHAHILSGLAHDVDHACTEWEHRIEASGGIDLQILGIGSNGHIAFNEPGSSLTSRTRVVELAERTVQDNARFFDRPDKVPRTAVTMGIGTILEARCLLLMATGDHKAHAVAAALEGPITPDVPASALQRHTNVHVLLDSAAASQLSSV